MSYEPLHQDDTDYFLYNKHLEARNIFPNADFVCDLELAYSPWYSPTYSPTSPSYSPTSSDNLEILDEDMGFYCVQDDEIGFYSFYVLSYVAFALLILMIVIPNGLVLWFYFTERSIPPLVKPFVQNAALMPLLVLKHGKQMCHEFMDAKPTWHGLFLHFLFQFLPRDLFQLLLGLFYITQVAQTGLTTRTTLNTIKNSLKMFGTFASGISYIKRQKLLKERAEKQKTHRKACVTVVPLNE
jgi:hypothetical protein